MTWQWDETLVEIMGTLANIGELPNRGTDTTICDHSTSGGIGRLVTFDLA